LLDGAQPFYDFLLARLSRLHDARTDRGRRQIAEEMVPWLCRLRDPIQQASFVQRTATRLDVREEAVRQAMKHFLQRGSRARTEAETEVEDEARPVGLPAERTLLQLMLADERVVEVVAERLDREWLTDGLAGDLMVHVLDLHVRRAWNGAPSLLTATNDAGQGLVAELLLEALPGGEPAVVATECVVAIERHYLEARMRQLRKQLAAANLPATRTAELQQQVLDLRRRLDHIAAPLRDRTTNSGH
jgi:DNA primase